MSAMLARGWRALLGCLAICFAAVGVNGWLTAQSVDGWYQSLDKPWFNPPGWLFGPAWYTLFTLMAIALWRVWMRAPAGGARRAALVLFAVQLGANMLWSGLFFAAQRPGWALAEIVVLEALILATTAAFARVDRPAAWLLVPYAAWVAFASVLNAALWWLN